MTDIKIGIAGAGAMGCKFGVGFISSGFEVFFYEKNRYVAEQIMMNGLDVACENNTRRNYPLNISTEPEVLKNTDIVFIFTKSFDTGSVVSAIKGICSPETVIVTFQNGLGNYEKITGHFSQEKIVFGSTTEGAAKLPDGMLIPGGEGCSTFGGAGETEVSLAAELLSDSGFNMRITPDPMAAVWRKAVINSAINPPAAVLGLTNGELIENGFAFGLAEMVLAESTAAAASAGVNIDRDEALAETVYICGKTGVNRCSMLQDIENGRKTEIDSISGIIVETAERAGLRADCNKTLYYIVKALESRGKK